MSLWGFPIGIMRNTANLTLVVYGVDGVNTKDHATDITIDAVVRTMRSVPLSDNKFDIGTEYVKIPTDGLNRITKYVSSANQG